MVLIGIFDLWRVFQHCHFSGAGWDQSAVSDCFCITCFPLSFLGYYPAHLTPAVLISAHEFCHFCPSVLLPISLGKSESDCERLSCLLGLNHCSREIQRGAYVGIIAKEVCGQSQLMWCSSP